MSITVDDSAEQTKNVIRAIAKQDGAPARPDLDEWHTLQHWLEDGPRDVAIPFAVELAELIPPIAVRLRRDVGTLLALVRAHALLHRATRQIVDHRVVATLDDYATVRELVASVISDTLGQSVSPATRELVEAVADITGAGAQHATYADLIERLKIDRSSISRRARVAITAGYVRNDEERKGKPARIVIGDPLPGDVLVLPTTDQVAERCSVAVDSERPPTRACGLGDAASNGHALVEHPIRREPACCRPEHRRSDYALGGATVWICGRCHPPGPALRAVGLIYRDAEASEP